MNAPIRCLNKPLMASLAALHLECLNASGCIRIEGSLAGSGEGTIPALVRWEEGNYILPPAETSPTLHLSAIAADRTIHLVWTVNAPLPPTSTWQIDCSSQTGTTYLPITGIISSTRAYALTDLANYVSYTITLRAMLDAIPVLSGTVRATPTDRIVYLPLATRGGRPRMW
jgi:hypothetical protein